MKKIHFKKATNKSSPDEAVPHHSSANPPEKESKQKSPKSPKGERKKVTTKTNANASNFSESESKVTSVSSNQNSVILTTKIMTSDILKQKKSKEGEKSPVIKSGKSEKKSPKSDKSTKSHLVERFSTKLLPRKKKELSNINLKTIKKIKTTKKNGKTFQSKIKKIVLKTEKTPEKIAPPAQEIEMGLLDKKTDPIDSSTDKNNPLWLINKKTEVNKPNKTQEGKKNVGFRRTKSFSATRLVNYISEKKGSCVKKKEIVESKPNVKKYFRPKLLKEKFTDPEVPIKEDLKTKQYFRDIFIYIIYLIFLTTVAFSMVSSSMFYLTHETALLFLDTEFQHSTEKGKVLKNLKFTHKNNLRQASTIEDFWNFAETTMVDILYRKFYVMIDKNVEKKLLHQNQILGRTRIRQLRVKDNSCLIHPQMRNFFDKCYSYYSPLVEETDPIKEGMENSSTATAWVYTKSEKLETSYFVGEVSTYGGGGYYLDFNKNMNQTKQMLKELKDNQWISKATRAVFIDFNLYNANVNLFCLCKLLLEFPPFGGIITETDFHSLKIIRYLTTFDFFILGCEFILVLFIFHFTWELFDRMLKQKTNFFKLFWNEVDFVIVIFSFIFIILSIIRYLYANKLVQEQSLRSDEYIEFHKVRDIQIIFNDVIACLLFVSWIKLFYFLSFNEIALELKYTVKESLFKVLSFLPIFILANLAFAFLAYLMFGYKIKEYSTLWYSFLSLLLTPLGGFPSSRLIHDFNFLESIFYIAYIFFVFFIFMNVFVAIIIDSYAKAKSEVFLIKPRIEEYAKRGFLNFFTCCRIRKKLKLKISTRKKLRFEKIRTALETAGFTKNEIKIFFTKYNINIGNILHDSTRQKIIDDLDLNRVDFGENERQTEINYLKRKIESLNCKLEDMEVNLIPVIDKVDILIDKLVTKNYAN